MAIWSRFFGGAASTAAGFGVGSALGPALNPITQKVANEVWKDHPDKPVTAQQAAELAARGFWDIKDARSEGHFTGYNDDRNAALFALAGHPPTVEQAFALRNRDKLTEGELDDALHESGIPDRWRTPLKALRTVLVPVSDLVRMAVREVFDPGQRAALTLNAEFPTAMLDHSRALGLTDQAALDYWAAHWNLPSVEQAFEMYHRKIIEPEELGPLLKALDYAPTWRGKLRQLAERIPPISDMIRFAVREVYDPASVKALGLDTDFPDDFAKEAALHGMNRTRAEQYWAAHWKLPSAQQGYRMLWRTDLGEAGLRGLLKALDYPPKWRNKLMEISYNVPGRVDLRRMLAAGVLDRGEVKQGYKRLGYTDDDAETLTKFAEALVGGGTDGYVEKAKTQLWGTTHRSFLNGEADEPTVLQRLDLIGVPTAERDQIIELWTMERVLVRRQLTPAQVKKAYLKGVINPATGQPWTRDDAIGALIELGYASTDASVFLDTV